MEVWRGFCDGEVKTVHGLNLIFKVKIKMATFLWGYSKNDGVLLGCQMLLHLLLWSLSRSLLVCPAVPWLSTHWFTQRHHVWALAPFCGTHSALPPVWRPRNGRHPRYRPPSYRERGGELALCHFSRRVEYGQMITNWGNEDLHSE